MSTFKVTIGLQYKPKFPAPCILFRAKGEMAERVLLLARELGIQRRKDEHLAQLLYQLPEGSWIPQEHFALVADLLAQVYAIQQRDHKD